MENIAREFSARYLGSWILGRKKGTKEYFPLYIREVGPGRTEASTDFAVVVQDISGNPETQTYDHYEWDTSLPSSKVIQATDTTVVYLGQRADRQWKRGVGHGTFLVYNPMAVLRQELEENISGIKIPTKVWDMLSSSRTREGRELNAYIEEFFFPKYKTYKQAIDLLRANKAIHVAFSEHFFVSLAPDTPEFLLWRDCLPIGHANPYTGAIKCFDGLFNQEVIDFFKRRGTYDVEVS